MTRPHYLADEVPKMAAELVALRASLAAAQSRVAALRRLVIDIDALQNESEGVAGLHLNGDLASWEWLEANGWLDGLTEARLALSSPPPHDGERSERREGEP